MLECAHLVATGHSSAQRASNRDIEAAAHWHGHNRVAGDGCRAGAGTAVAVVNHKHANVGMLVPLIWGPNKATSAWQAPCTSGRRQDMAAPCPIAGAQLLSLTRAVVLSWRHNQHFDATGRSHAHSAYARTAGAAAAESARPGARGSSIWRNGAESKRQHVRHPCSPKLHSMHGTPQASSLSSQQAKPCGARLTQMRTWAVRGTRTKCRLGPAPPH